MELKAKAALLRGLLREMEGVAVGYSGGVDSALLARVAHEELGEKAVAVIARSPSLPGRELREALALAAEAGFVCRVIDTAEVDDPAYAANPVNRCYYCKQELFSRLEAVRAELGLPWIAYGENLDDAQDHRPGALAAREHQVRAPLREAGLTKADVREVARSLGMPVWDKPAFACLSSRFPYGTEITPERLAQVEGAEDALWEMGFRQFRVRYHGDVARIEVERADMERLLELGDRVAERVRAAGFLYVAMDLAGYRRGSLNEARLISGNLEEL